MKIADLHTNLPSITFVDIDETLFSTSAKIWVMKDGKPIKKLSNQEFNHYKLNAGEEFDFREFRSAEIFNKGSKPIWNVIKEVAKLINSKGPNSQVVLLTARGDFDDKETFLDTFREVGLNPDKFYVERTGNIKTGSVESKKAK